MKLSAIFPSFDGLREQIRAALQARDAWRDLNTSSTGQALIDFIAAVGTMMHFELQRSVEETNIVEARQEASIYSIAALLGVSPIRARGAEVRVTLSVPALIPESINLRKYDKFTVDGEDFFLTQDVTFPANTYSISDVTLRQGTVITVQFVSNGTKFQSFLVGSNFTVDNDYIDVTVGTDTTFWMKADSSLWQYSSSDKVVQINTMADGSVRLLFGDGNFGVIPNNGDTITVYYVLSSGSAGNKATSGLDVSPVVQPTYQGSPVGLTGLTISSISGGSDKESAETARFTIPRFFASARRAITRSDWRAIGLRFQGVKDINVWGEFEEGSRLEMMNTVKVCLLMATGAASQSEKDNFNTYMFDFKHVTTRISHVDAEAVDLAIDMDVYVRAGFQKNEIKATIIAKLASFFQIQQGVLGRAVYRADIIDLAMEVTGVDYVVLNSPTADISIQRHQYANLIPAPVINVFTSTRD